ncbi:hypothetical protein GBAR_LOCUS20630 [Geodia barretti]|uniref:Uncharacterized protein n=1 Tax=Geodia barretti TaxID=519541 RepID=A0AA35X3M8_GEOBA|nr:hypothetical protein GBAR_LOCUS20630 [Geodia barretti]
MRQMLPSLTPTISTKEEPYHNHKDSIIDLSECMSSAKLSFRASFHADFRKAVDGQLAIQKYIDQARMSLDGWGGDKEIRAFATMFQAELWELPPTPLPPPLPKLRDFQVLTTYFTPTPPLTDPFLPHSDKKCFD